MTLTPPAGSPISADDVYSDGAETVYAFTVVSPTTGLWTVQVTAVGAPVVATYQAAGYANDGSTIQAILTSESGPIISYPDEAVLVASLSADKAIAHAHVTAWVEKPDGSFADITFKDDGIAPDADANDGNYTALLPYAAPGDYHVTAEFDNNAGTAVFTEEGQADGATISTTVPNNFERAAALQVLVQDYAGDDHGSINASASDLLPNNSDMPGQIDKAGDIDVFRATSPVPSGSKTTQLVKGQTGQMQASATTRFALRLTHFAFGMNATVIVTTTAGTKTYHTGALGYNQYWSLPLDLAPEEAVYVEVLHNSGQATIGSYDISFGKPLPGEFTGRTVYMPLTLR